MFVGLSNQLLSSLFEWGRGCLLCYTAVALQIREHRVLSDRREAKKTCTVSLVV